MRPQKQTKTARRCRPPRGSQKPHPSLWLSRGAPGADADPRESPRSPESTKLGRDNLRRPTGGFGLRVRRRRPPRLAEPHPSLSLSRGASPAVSFHNFNLRIFNLRVSNPNKLIVDVLLTRCRISMCQGLCPKKHDEISEIDRRAFLEVILSQSRCAYSFPRRPPRLASPNPSLSLVHGAPTTGNLQ